MIRGKCNSLQALPQEITLITGNLPSGYHRDLQLLKEKLFPAFGILDDCLQMTQLMLAHIEVKKDILHNPKYKYLFSVEEVNKLVMEGVPFRDAYKQIGQQIEKGEFTYSTEINHTHEGSAGNLCNSEIKKMMESEIKEFQFEKVNQKLRELIK